MRTRTSLALALTALLTAPLASHAADSLNGAFFTGSIGKSWYNGNTSMFGNSSINDGKTSYAATFGMRWNGWGWDIGYVNSGNFDVIGNGTRVKVKGWTLGPNYKYMITPHWFVGARAGFFRYDITGIAPTKQTGTRFYGGVGGGYDFSDGVGLGLNYTYYQAKKLGSSYDFGTLMGTVELRFN